MNEVVATVVRAIEEIRHNFEDCVVETNPDGHGGTSVVVRGIPMGHPYVQPKIWVGFLITQQYPYADVYPHFTNAELARVDGNDVGGGFGTAFFQDQPAIQISRRSNKLNREQDTAALKLLRVIKWMKNPT